MRNRQKNGAKTLSLLLLKEKGTTVMEGRADRGRQNGGARNSLPFPFNVDKTRPDQCDVPCMTERLLIRRDVARPWPTPTALQTTTARQA